MFMSHFLSLYVQPKQQTHHGRATTQPHKTDSQFILDFILWPFKQCLRGLDPSYNISIFLTSYSAQIW